jgi:hypothetical protein
MTPPWRKRPGRPSLTTNNKIIVPTAWSSTTLINSWITEDEGPNSFVGEFHYDTDTGKITIRTFLENGGYEEIEIHDLNEIQKILTRKLLKEG